MFNDKNKDYTTNHHFTTQTIIHIYCILHFPSKHTYIVHYCNLDPIWYKQTSHKINNKILQHVKSFRSCTFFAISRGDRRNNNKGKKIGGNNITTMESVKLSSSSRQTLLKNTKKGVMADRQYFWFLHIFLVCLLSSFFIIQK